mmetsp:Transcript_22009/g.18869  ORF Transcript_22009/g.18869 Transcript_22009/m.18869 type:complete len:84 (+) Transcript_22009:45-296(+)
MKSFIIFTAILALALARRIQLRDDSYTYLVLAVEWAPTVCSENNCNSHGANKWFNMHGLWPSGGSNPGYCSKDFNLNNISSST